jgi:hypothetical protein
MRSLSRALLPVLLFIGALVPLTACDEADEAIDCAMICNRYKDCFDNAYDTEACRNRCEDNADNVADFDDHADDCENCLDDRSCTGSFACVDECSGIVP